MKKVKINWPKIEAVMLKTHALAHNNWTDVVKSYEDEHGYVNASEESNWYIVQGYTILKEWTV